MECSFRCLYNVSWIFFIKFFLHRDYLLCTKKTKITMRVHDSTTHSCDGVDAGAENNCDVTILIVLNAGNLKLNKPIRA